MSYLTPEEIGKIDDAKTKCAADHPLTVKVYNEGATPDPGGNCTATGSRRDGTWKNKCSYGQYERAQCQKAALGADLYSRIGQVEESQEFNKKLDEAKGKISEEIEKQRPKIIAAAEKYLSLLDNYELSEMLDDFKAAFPTTTQATWENAADFFLANADPGRCHEMRRGAGEIPMSNAWQAAWYHTTEYPLPEAGKNTPESFRRWAFALDYSTGNNMDARVQPLMAALADLDLKDVRTMPARNNKDNPIDEEDWCQQEDGQGPYWPQMWAVNVCLAIAMLKYLKTNKFDGEGKGAGEQGPYGPPHIDNFKAGDMSFGFNKIMLHNHQGRKGMYPYGDTPPEACEFKVRGANSPAKQATVDAGGGYAGSQGNNNWSIYSTLTSGGPFMMVAEIDDLFGGNLPAWRKYQNTATNVGVGGKFGTWSMYAYGERMIMHADMMLKWFTANDPGAGPRPEAHQKMFRALKGWGAAFKSAAAELYAQSKIIADAYTNIRKVQCETAKDFAGKHPDTARGLKELFGADYTQEDEARREARSAIDIADLQVSDAYYGGDQAALLFREQCFLLSFIPVFSTFKKTELDSAVLMKKEGDTLSYEMTTNTSLTKRLPYVSSEMNAEKQRVAENATLLLDGDPYGFMNVLTQNPSAARLFNMPNHELSNLQPHIRLWKVVFDDEGNEEDIEIHFDEHFTHQDLRLFQTRRVRGVGAGVKSFNFTYDGSNPFAVKKSIKANLKIFANTFSELMRDRGGYSYIDLAMKTWNTNEVPGNLCDPRWGIREENVKNSELNFRLKAQVGLSVPVNVMSSLSKATRDALSESYVTLNLTPTVHNFEFDEMGRVVFNLNFLAYIEQFFDQKHFNVFAEPTVTLDRYRREFKLKKYAKECAGTEQLSKLKEKYAASVENEKRTAISSIMQAMMEQDLIYYVNIPYTKVKTFLLKGPHASYEEVFPTTPEGSLSHMIANNAGQNAVLKGRIKEAMKKAFKEVPDQDKDKNAIAAALVGTDPQQTTLSYFYISDLIDMVLVKIGKELNAVLQELDGLTGEADISCQDVNARKSELQKALAGFKKMRVLLGPVEFTSPAASEGVDSVFVNFGDVPISTKYFVEWLTNKMLKKDEIFYPLTKFINDLLNDLVRNFLNSNECFSYSIKQKTRVNQAAITAWSKSTQYDGITMELVDLAADADAPWQSGNPQPSGMLLTRASTDTLGGRPLLPTSGPSNSRRTTIPSSNAFHYFVYFAGRTMPTELMKGDKASDESRGIFHYKLGRDRGLLKNIKLSKTQTKGLAEVRFEQDGYDGLQQLRVIYDAQVDMFANVNTYPGTYIYISPKGFAPDMPAGIDAIDWGLTDLGVGGYYMIVRSEHEFAPGVANTILHTKWVNQIDAEGQSHENELISQESGTGDPTTRKCSLENRSDPSEDQQISGGGSSGVGNAIVR